MAEVKSGKKAKKEAPLTETGDVQRVTDFLIKPESSVPRLDTSKWPLLLKVRRRTSPWFLALLPATASGATACVWRSPAAPPGAPHHIAAPTLPLVPEFRYPCQPGLPARLFSIRR